jgi:hypothetical protein
MCQIADRWAATVCLGYILEWLIQRPEEGLSCAQLAEALPQLPDSMKTLPHHPSWEDRCMQVISSSDASSITMPILLYLFGDVHALLTSAVKLKCFCQLPYPAVKAWAGRDDLVVDSENSVAVALGSWVEAQADRSEQECSTEQKEELSGLLRVKHLSPGTWMMGCSTYSHRSMLL